MRRIIIPTLLFTAFGIISISSQFGVATIQNKDRTGSPVGTTKCNACHTGATFSVSISASLKDASGMVVTSYDPDTNYVYEVTLSSTGASAYGFEAVSLLASSNLNAGTLNVGSSNTKLKVLSGRTYADHTDRSTLGVFTLNWTAPAAGSGTVNFYTCGIGCNSNSAPTGDKAASGNILTITENPANGINENEILPMQIYPNPVSEFLYLKSTVSESGTLRVFDLQGQLISTFSLNIQNGATQNIDVTNFNSGTYLINFSSTNGKNNFTMPFLKK